MCTAKLFSVSQTKALLLIMTAVYGTKEADLVTVQSNASLLISRKQLEWRTIAL